MEQQDTYLAGKSGRRFAAFAAAVLVFIIDEQERLLMLSHPARPGKWEVVNGAMDAGDTVLSAALRETAEEAGPAVRVRPLGAFHAYTFRYDEAVSHMISVCYLCAYRGGEVTPGDDMAGSAVRWWSLEEIEAEDAYTVAPRIPQRWVLRRAVECYRLWKDQPDPLLQPPLDQTRNKYEA